MQGDASILAREGLFFPYCTCFSAGGGQSRGQTAVSFCGIYACDGCPIGPAHPLYGGDVDGVVGRGVEDVSQVKHLTVAASKPEVPLSIFPQVLRLCSTHPGTPRAEQGLS